MLSDQNLAAISNDLQVPRIIGDVLSGVETLGDDGHFALHGLLSDMEPDEALLAIALGAEKLALVCGEGFPGAGVLKMESGRIVGEYAPARLRRAQAGHGGQGALITAEDTVLETLAYVPEDLESLAELLEFAGENFACRHEDAAALCEILAVQARAQALVAEAFLDMAAEEEGVCTPALCAPAPVSAAPRHNVILFPLRG